MSAVYVASGSVRGSCGHQHRTLKGATGCVRRDQRSCGRLGGGSYSDRTVHRADGVALTTDEMREIDHDEEGA